MEFIINVPNIGHLQAFRIQILRSVERSNCDLIHGFGCQVFQSAEEFASAQLALKEERWVFVTFSTTAVPNEFVLEIFSVRVDCTALQLGNLQRNQLPLLFHSQTGCLNLLKKILFSICFADCEL